MSTRPSNAKPEPIRLGLGEVVDSYGWLPQIFARHLFLEVLSRLAPEVVNDLKAEPLRCLRQIDADLLRLTGLTGAEYEAEWDRLHQPLYGLVRTWRVRHNLGTKDFPWGDGDAIHTLRLWQEQERNGEMLTNKLVSFLPLTSFVPNPRANRSFEFEWTTSFLPAGKIITIPPVTWNPRVETRREGIERILGEVKQHLEAQMDEHMEHRQARGDMPVPIKKGGARHFAWLVRYQVQRWTYADLARETGHSATSIMEAIRETAALLRLPLREPDHGGRPRRRRPRAHTVVVKQHPSSM